MAVEPSGKQYWRSLDELADRPEFKEFIHREFPAHASEMLDPLSRRTFLNLMAASIGLAGGLTACRRPTQKILPYASMPEYTVEGMPKYYATSLDLGGQSYGVIAKSYDGRPIKLEGNGIHPVTAGKTNGLHQSMILELYDPDRHQKPLHNHKSTSMETFRVFLLDKRKQLEETRGRGFRILSELTTSPALLQVRDAFIKAHPEAQWHFWDPINQDNQVRGSRLATGQPVLPRYDLKAADVILALDSDFLHEGPDHLQSMRDFSGRRRGYDHQVAMNRLYSVESRYTLTGGMADHRKRMPASQIQKFIMALAKALPPEAGLKNIPGLTSFLEGVDTAGLDEKWINALSADLVKHRGKSLVIAGAGQPAIVHAIAAVMNLHLGSGSMIHQPLIDPEFEDVTGSLTSLVASMQSGQVDTLLMLGGNPVYDAPADLQFSQALAKVQHTVHLSLYNNETSAECEWVLPKAHVLESWGTTRTTSGQVCTVQPLIAPLFDGCTTSLEVMAELSSGEARDGYDLIREYFQTALPPGEALQQYLDKSLQDGLASNLKVPPVVVQAAVNTSALKTELDGHPIPAAPSATSLEVNFFQDANVYDGRFANNGWLQETPDPVTKLVWDNAALMSAGTAKELNLSNEDLVELTIGGQSVEIGVWIVPGMSDHVVAVALGYGRIKGGRIATSAGVNVYPVRTAAAMDSAMGAKIRKTGRRYPGGLASVQDHWSMEGRDLIREMDVNYRDHSHQHGEPHSSGHGGHDAGEKDRESQLWKEPVHEGHENAEQYSESPQWGMVFDLSACSGCNACMVACQAENNIPVVGKQQVANAREMSWIRIDRYFSGTQEELDADPGGFEDKVGMSVQPINCQQCETAPCEQVCPVAATTHSPDGLNEMTYNRCIGTRYCLNNCPYKVRRFNFFNYHTKEADVKLGPLESSYSEVENLYDGGNPDLVAMAANPDVTVRSRGVMEKCTYCVQRISRGKQIAGEEGRPVADGEVQTACQQACPAQAISFGDITDHESDVSKMKSNDVNYTLLDHLRTRPRTSFLPKMRNQNPELV
jgi:MoCo/4Fe-4S cofactor protein with predicted Tat translocation signal